LVVPSKLWNAVNADCRLKGQISIRITAALLRKVLYRF
jgi:hypothetical protein